MPLAADNFPGKSGRVRMGSWNASDKRSLLLIEQPQRMHAGVHVDSCRWGVHIHHLTIRRSKEPMAIFHSHGIVDGALGARAARPPPVTATRSDHHTQYLSVQSHARPHAQSNDFTLHHPSNSFRSILHGSLLAICRFARILQIVCSSELERSLGKGVSATTHHSFQLNKRMNSGNDYRE